MLPGVTARRSAPRGRAPQFNRLLVVARHGLGDFEPVVCERVGGAASRCGRRGVGLGAGRLAKHGHNRAFVGSKAGQDRGDAQRVARVLPGHQGEAGLDAGDPAG